MLAKEGCCLYRWYYLYRHIVLVYYPCRREALFAGGDPGVSMNQLVVLSGTRNFDLMWRDTRSGALLVLYEIHILVLVG